MFNKDGDLKSETAEAQPRPETPPAEEPRLGTGSESQGKPKVEHPPASLSSLVIGLATSAQIHLGEHSPDGQSPPQPPDLPSAKYVIDLLNALSEKTKGNLDEGEEQLLKAILYDLRMKYVSLAKP
jgi:hypothetical protein